MNYAKQRFASSTPIRWNPILDEVPAPVTAEYQPGDGYGNNKNVAGGIASIALHILAVASIFLGWIGTVGVTPEEPATSLTLSPIPASPAAPPVEQPPGPEQDKAQEILKPRVEDVPVPPEPLVRLPDPPRTVQEQPPQPQPRPQEPAPQQRQPAEQTTRPQPTQLPPRPNPGAPNAGNPNQSTVVRDPAWAQRVTGKIERAQVRPASSPPEEVDTVVVRITMDRNGRLISQSVVASRGIARLNAASLDAVRRASPFPPPPASAPGATVTVNVAVRWTLANNVRRRR